MSVEMKEVKMSIPASADYIDIVRLTLYGIANKLGFSYEDIEDLKVAVSEACSNAVLHAYKGRMNNGQIDISFAMDHARLLIRVADQGTGFEYKAEEARPIAEQTDVQEVAQGGLGLYLMQALVDEVEVKSGSGTEVLLTKYFQRSETIS